MTGVRPENRWQCATWILPSSASRTGAGCRDARLEESSGSGIVLVSKGQPNAMQHGVLGPENTKDATEGNAPRGSVFFGELGCPQGGGHGLSREGRRAMEEHLTKRRNAGFTVVELLVAMALIVLVLVILPAVQRVRQVATGMGSQSNLSHLSSQLHTFADGIEPSLTEMRHVLNRAVNGEEPDPEVLRRLRQEFGRHEVAVGTLLDEVKALLRTSTNREERRLLREARKFLIQVREGVQKAGLLLAELLVDGSDPNDP